MMIKKIRICILNLRVAVIYKKYSLKKESLYKALKRLKRVKQSKIRRKDHYKYPSRAFCLLTDSSILSVFIACVRHVSWRKMKRTERQMKRPL